MNVMLKGALIAVAIMAVTGMAATLVFVKATGLSALATPGAVETAVARQLRGFATPSEYRNRSNPILFNEESVRSGMAHFADHCASCHANDGSGSTEMGKKLFPPAPDMRAAATQSLTDGELFYLIEHGVRFTGMPGWSNGTMAGEEATWHLVNFVRQLPKLTPAQIEEMAAINPRPPDEIRQEIEAERFLAGEDIEAAAAAPAHAH
jgi:mono/diheme cytochrome c family protein